MRLENHIIIKNLKTILIFKNCGYLAKYLSTNNFASGIDYLLDEVNFIQLSINIKNKLKKFSYESISIKYKKVVYKLLIFFIKSFKIHFKLNFIFQLL